MEGGRELEIDPKPKAYGAQSQCAHGVPTSMQWSKGTKIKVLFKVDKRLEYIEGTVTKNNARTSITVDFSDGDTLTYTHSDLHTIYTAMALKKQRPSIQQANNLLHLLSKIPDSEMHSATLQPWFEAVSFQSDLHRMRTKLLDADPDPTHRNQLMCDIVGIFKDLEHQLESKKIGVNRDVLEWVTSITLFDSRLSPLQQKPLQKPTLDTSAKSEMDAFDNSGLSSERGSRPTSPDSEPHDITLDLSNITDSPSKLGSGRQYIVQNQFLQCMPLGRAGASSQTFAETIDTDLKTVFPFLFLGETDEPLLAFSQFVHKQIVDSYNKDVHGQLLTRVELENLALAQCIHEEIADHVIGLICALFSGCFVDSCSELHAGGGAQGFVESNPSATETLVLSTTLSALLLTDPQRLLRNHKLLFAEWLTRFKTWIWILNGDKHYTALEMNIGEVVVVRLADSNALRPKLDSRMVSNLKMLLDRFLKPTKDLVEMNGLALPRQNSMNNCLFHIGQYVEEKLHASEASWMSSKRILKQTEQKWIQNASRQRVYITMLVYKYMRTKDYTLKELGQLYVEWFKQDSYQDAPVLALAKCSDDFVKRRSRNNTSGHLQHCQVHPNA